MKWNSPSQASNQGMMKIVFSWTGKCWGASLKWTGRQKEVQGPPCRNHTPNLLRLPPSFFCIKSSHYFLPQDGNVIRGTSGVPQFSCFGMKAVSNAQGNVQADVQDCPQTKCNVSASNQFQQPPSWCFLCFRPLCCLALLPSFATLREMSSTVLQQAVM